MEKIVVIKNPFADLQKMQKVAVATLCAVFLMASGCGKSKATPEEKEPLSDEQISFNLSKNGNIDPELLIGEWNAIAFAYTADGNKITDMTAISSRFSVIINDLNFINDECVPMYFNPCLCIYSSSGNLLKYIQEKSTCFAVLIQYTDDEQKIADALRNTYSFVIKGNELIIHFTGVENRNLLILKKR